MIITLMVGVVLVFALACGSADEGSGAAAAEVADLSQFPTPTRSQAAPAPEPTTQAVAAQTQAEVATDDGGSEAAEVQPMSQEELQQLRARLQSGELSEEEQQEAIQRLRAQFGGGQGGGGFGGGGGVQAVGSIESVGEGSVTVVTELATVTANVGENTNVSITSLLEPTALTDGAQVLVVSERVDASTLARLITVVPEGQGGFGRGRGAGLAGQAAAGGGQAGQQGGGGARPLFGTIESIADSGFTLETQQGPLPIAMNEETVIIQTSQGTLDDLEAGMQVRVAGAENEDGTIEARLVAVTPEGLEDLVGLGAGRGFGGGRGAFGGGQGGGGN